MIVGDSEDTILTQHRLLYVCVWGRGALSSST